MLHIIWTFLIGILVGWIATYLMPGPPHLGLLMTGILGIAGSFVGGFIARMFSPPARDAIFHPAGLIMSVIGALIILYVARHLH